MPGMRSQSDLHSLKKIDRSLRDWFTPLDGCPRCGYPYEREPGYYLMSIWAINYGVGSIVGLAIYGLLEWKFRSYRFGSCSRRCLCRSFSSACFSRDTPKPCFLRSIFSFDPHEKEGGNDGGKRSAAPRVPAGDPAIAKPVPPCDPADLVR